MAVRLRCRPLGSSKIYLPSIILSSEIKISRSERPLILNVWKNHFESITFLAHTYSDPDSEYGLIYIYYKLSLSGLIYWCNKLFSITDIAYKYKEAHKGPLCNI